MSRTGVGKADIDVGAPCTWARAELSARVPILPSKHLEHCPQRALWRTETWSCAMSAGCSLGSQSLLQATNSHEYRILDSLEQWPATRITITLTHGWSLTLKSMPAGEKTIVCVLFDQPLTLLFNTKITYFLMLTVLTRAIEKSNIDQARTLSADFSLPFVNVSYRFQILIRNNVSTADQPIIIRQKHLIKAI
jgi:hypothetical protein